MMTTDCQDYEPALSEGEHLVLCSPAASRLQTLDSLKPGEKVNGDRCLGEYFLLVQQGWAA